jgi:hypothetical protein
MADFGAALGAMRRGLKVRRADWKNLGMAFALVKDGLDNEVLVLVHSDRSQSLIENVHISNITATDWEHIPAEAGVS